MHLWGRGESDIRAGLDGDIRAGLDDGVVAGLRPASFLLAVLFAFYAVLHAVQLSGGAAPVMTVLALVTAAAAVVLAMLLARDRVRPGWGHRIAAGFAVLVLVNIFVQYALTGDDEQRIDLLLALVGIGLCLVDPRWVAGLTAGGMGGWVATVLLTHPDQAQWARTAPDLVTAAAIAAMANALRHRSLLRLLATETRLRELADCDALTGLLNRRGFLERARDLLSEHPTGACVWFFDLDDLKIVNDAYGHACGDEALRAVGEVLRARFGERAAVARLSGDEFAVAAAGDDAPDAIRAAVEAQVVRAGEDLRLPLSVSVGYACAKPGQDLSSLLQEADTSMYVAKAARSALPRAARPLLEDR